MTRAHDAAVGTVAQAVVLVDENPVFVTARD